MHHTYIYSGRTRITHALITFLFIHNSSVTTQLPVSSLHNRFCSKISQVESGEPFHHSTSLTTDDDSKPLFGHHSDSTLLTSLCYILLNLYLFLSGLLLSLINAVCQPGQGLYLLLCSLLCNCVSCFSVSSFPTLRHPDLDILR